MTNQKGTPKNLDELSHEIIRVLREETGPAIQHIIRDYLSQKFGVAVLENPDINDRLMALFKTIVEQNPK